MGDILAMDSSTPTTAAAAIAAHTEREKMLRGDLYYASDPELCAARARCAAAVAEFNSARGDLPRRDRVALQNKILNLPPPPENPADPDLPEYPYLLPPVFVDYGANLSISAGSFVNFNCCFLDTCQISIGPRVLVAPGVSFYAATHPVDPRVRNGLQGPEMGKPITVEEDVWIGGAAVICPGVTLGKGCVVGAGSVVTKSVEPYTIVAGNPARVIKKIDMSQPPPQVPPPPPPPPPPPTAPSQPLVTSQPEHNLD